MFRTAEYIDQHMAVDALWRRNRLVKPKIRYGQENGEQSADASKISSVAGREAGRSLVGFATPGLKSLLIVLLTELLNNSQMLLQADFANSVNGARH
jgi:hypothetical protein